MADDIDIEHTAHHETDQASVVDNDMGSPEDKRPRTSYRLPGEALADAAIDPLNTGENNMTDTKQHVDADGHHAQSNTADGMDEVGSDVEYAGADQDDDSTQQAQDEESQDMVAPTQQHAVGEEDDAKSDATPTGPEDADTPDDSSDSDHPDIRNIIPVVPLLKRIDCDL